MAEERSFGREIACLAEVFDFVGGFLTEHQLGGKVEFALNFVVEELFTNMVKYNTGNGQEIKVRLDKDPAGVHVELIDYDVDPFDPSELPEVDTTKSAEERVPGGLGIHLVKSLVDQITYSYDHRIMRVKVLKSLES